MYSRLEINVQGLTAQELSVGLMHLANAINEVRMSCGQNDRISTTDGNFPGFLMGVGYFLTDEGRSVGLGSDIFFPEVEQDEYGYHVFMSRRFRRWVGSNEPIESIVK